MSLHGLPAFQHIELAEHGFQAATAFYHLGKGTLSYPQRLQGAQPTDQIDTPLARLHQLHRVVLL
jgi:hypothetical protein